MLHSTEIEIEFEMTAVQPSCCEDYREQAMSESFLRYTDVSDSEAVSLSLIRAEGVKPVLSDETFLVCTESM